MGMEEAAQQMAQEREQTAATIRQRNEDWAVQAMEDLAPVITEYAQALSRVDVRPTQMNAGMWFRPRLVLIDRAYQDDVPAATCQFGVHPSGEWSWADKPSYNRDAAPAPVSVESVRNRLTEILSRAIASAGQ